MTLSMGIAEAFFGKWGSVVAWDIAGGTLYESLEYIYTYASCHFSKKKYTARVSYQPAPCLP